jgi:hypothetical protein
MADEGSHGRPDQGFGFGPRDQSGGGDGEVEAPELTVADDERQRLARNPPRDQRLVLG